MLSFAVWKRLIVLSVCLMGVFLAFPNFLKDKTQLPPWLPSLVLGLDLQGGSYLLLEIQLDKAYERTLKNFEKMISLDLRKEEIFLKDFYISPEKIVFLLRQSEKHLKVEEILKNYFPDVELKEQKENSYHYVFSGLYLKNLGKDILERTMEVVRRRIDETGTKEPRIQSQGDNRIIVELPGVGDPKYMKELMGRTAQLGFHMVGSPGLKTVFSAGGGEQYRLSVVPDMTGQDLIDSRVSFQEGRPIVTFKFNSQGARQFSDLTSRNIGVPMAIVLDGKVISAPVINDRIGASGIITGNFTTQEASDLALLLRSGALPAEILFLEERTVGPGLGEDSILYGKRACVLALLLVMCFMIYFYGIFGVFACITLLMNLVIVIGILSSIGATLTLPGIAGLVLMVGMVVDANVLIFEKIREQVLLESMHTKISLGRCLSQGFDNAFTTIVDSNVTTLLAAICLYYFGMGPIRGFSVTLGIGILTSMFTAILLTKMLIFIWYSRQCVSYISYIKKS